MPESRLYDRGEHGERASLQSFAEIVSLSKEILCLWKLLASHDMTAITSDLTLETRKILCATTFSSFVVRGHQVIRITVFGRETRRACIISLVFLNKNRTNYFSAVVFYSLCNLAYRISF